jgi:hypothetical protein
VSSRTALKIPGALLNPPPEADMPFNSKKAGKVLGKAIGKPFTAMYAAGGEFPVSIPTPADARMQGSRPPQPKSEKEREKEKEKGREKDDEKKGLAPSETPARHTPTKSEKDRPAEVTRAPEYPLVPPAPERYDSNLLGAQRPRLDSRPESGLLPHGATILSGYQDEKHAIVTSPSVGPLDAASNATERWSDYTYANSKHSSGSQMRSVDDAEDHIRELFNALPPEAQALAYARLAEQRERERQLAAKREQAMMWEREAEARIERELREKERARIERERADQRDRPGREHYDAYDGAHLSSPAGRVLPPIPSGRRQQSGEQSGDQPALGRQTSIQRRAPVGPRRRPSPQEEIEEQIAQLIEAQTLPPRPAGSGPSPPGPCHAASTLPEV